VAGLHELPEALKTQAVSIAIERELDTPSTKIAVRERTLATTSISPVGSSDSDTSDRKAASLQAQVAELRSVAARFEAECDDWKQKYLDMQKCATAAQERFAAVSPVGSSDSDTSDRKAASLQAQVAELRSVAARFEAAQSAADSGSLMRTRGQAWSKRCRIGRSLSTQPRATMKHLQCMHSSKVEHF
jgi:hypothetical protein